MLIALALNVNEYNKGAKVYCFSTASTAIIRRLLDQGGRPIRKFPGATLPEDGIALFSFVP